MDFMMGNLLIVYALVASVVIINLWLAHFAKKCLKARAQHVGNLINMDMKRTIWLSEWAVILATDQSSAAQKARGALAAVKAAQGLASSDWSWAPSTEAVLHMEWFWEEHLALWINSTARPQSAKSRLWQAAWANERKHATASALQYNIFFSSLSQRASCALLGYRPAIEWISQKEHTERSEKIQEALDKAFDF